MALHKIAIVSDHAGQELKQQVIAYLKTVNVEIQKENFAPLHGQSVDYPDQSRLVAEAIARAVSSCGSSTLWYWPSRSWDASIPRARSGSWGPSLATATRAAPRCR